MRWPSVLPAPSVYTAGCCSSSRQPAEAALAAGAVAALAAAASATCCTSCFCHRLAWGVPDMRGRGGERGP